MCGPLVVGHAAEAIQAVGGMFDTLSDPRVSSGNVFADLDVPEPVEALAKAELAREIGAIFAKRRLSQTHAADLLGVDQPKVSALLHGRLTGFSIDRLLRFLLALNRDVEIVIRPTENARDHGRVRVVDVA